MGKAEGRRHRDLFLGPVEERIEAIIAIGLQDTAELGQMPLRMFTPPVAGGVEDGRRRRRPAKWPVVANVGPYSAGGTLALGENRDGCIVAVQSLSGKHMGLDEIEERLNGGAGIANLVGKRLGGQINPLASEAAALAVKRLMLGELVEDDGGEQVGTEEATWRCMEGCGRLADAAAVPAGKLFPHGLDHLEAARDLLQRLSDILAELRQAFAAAVIAGTGRVDDDALALDSLWPRLAHWPLAGEGTHDLGFGRRSF